MTAEDLLSQGQHPGRVRATAVAHPKAKALDPLFLREAEYRVVVEGPDGSVSRIFTIHIDVGPPPVGHATISVTGTPL